MKNTVKKAWQYGLYVWMLFVALAPLNSHAHTTPILTSVESGCEPPSVAKTGQSYGYVSFAWNAVGGATGYQIWYVNKGNNNSSWIYSTGNTSIEFPSLAPGTYDFYFKTVCEGGVSEIVIIEDIIIL